MKRVLTSRFIGLRGPYDGGFTVLVMPFATNRRGLERSGECARVPPGNAPLWFRGPFQIRRQRLGLANGRGFRDDFGPIYTAIARCQVPLATPFGKCGSRFGGRCVRVRSSLLT